MWRDKLKAAFSELESLGYNTLYSFTIGAYQSLSDFQNFIGVHAQELASADARGYFYISSDLADKQPILDCLIKHGFSAKLEKGTKDFKGRMIRVDLTNSLSQL